MSLMLLGALIGYIAIILANIDIDRTSDGMTLYTQLCRAQYWLLGLGFVLMFGTLALKTWRIGRIFCNAVSYNIRHAWTRDVLLLAGDDFNEIQ